MPCIVWTYLKSFNRLIYLFILNWSNSHSIILDHFLAQNSNFSSYKNNFPRKLLYTTATWRIIFYIFFLLQVPKKLLNVIGPAFLELADWISAHWWEAVNECLVLPCLAVRTAFTLPIKWSLLSPQVISLLPFPFPPTSHWASSWILLSWAAWWG